MQIWLGKSAFVLMALFQFMVARSDGYKDNLENVQTEFCAQVITCGKDGKYYPDPCQAQKYGGGVDETESACKKNDGKIYHKKTLPDK